MRTRNLRRGAGATGILASIGAGAMIVLAACGSAAPGGVAKSGSPAKSHQPAAGGPAAVRASAGVPLCLHIPQLTEVMVNQARPMGKIPFHEILPRGMIVTDVTAVRSLARALCALPPVRPGTMSCPIDLGGAYSFSFAGHGRGYPRVTVNPTGCRTVTGLGKPRTWGTTPGFAAVLKQILAGHSMLVPGKHGSVPTP